MLSEDVARAAGPRRGRRAVADVQVRSRGTIGGNVCSPTRQPLAAADRRPRRAMTIAGPRRRAQVPAEDFFSASTGRPSLRRAADAVTVPPGVGGGFASLTLGRRAPGRQRGRDRGRRRGPHRRRLRRRRPARRVELRLTATRREAAAAGLGETLDPPSDVHAPRRLPPARRGGARREGGAGAGRAGADVDGHREDDQRQGQRRAASARSRPAVC